MRLKVRTIVSLTSEQRLQLQQLGCDATPFIGGNGSLLFAATCTDEQEQELRKLECVIEVEPMPVYGIATQEG